MRFPLRRQQHDEASTAQLAPHGAPDPIPFPPVAGVQEPLPAGDPLAPPSGPLAARFSVPLRAQANASDARAERLIRQVRDDVERLQGALDALSSGQSELLEPDPAAIAADPEAAASLDPVTLVRAVVAVERENRRLRKRLGKTRQRELKLQAAFHELRLEHAARKGRLDTLEQVLSALHDNLQDLRQERAFVRGIGPGAAAPQRPGLPPGEAPR